MTNNTVETVEERGFIGRIHYDESPTSPREYDTLGVMVCFHRQYSLGDETDINSGDFEGWNAVERYLRKEKGAAIVIPLYLYDHSGITMRTAPFGDRWDSGQVGYIYTTKAAILKNFGGKILTKKRIDAANKCLQSEVETYDQYLTGDVYGYFIDGPDGETVSSCGGFFGLDQVKADLIAELRNLAGMAVGAAFIGE
jgi:hypothetical protein